MTETSTVFIPPVQLESFTEFMRVARDAAVVVFSPEYLQSPFLDDERRLRRLTVTAVGVKRKDVPLTFKYTVDHERAVEAHQGMDPSSALSKMVLEIRQELEYYGNVVNGNIDSETTLGELLEARP